MFRFLKTLSRLKKHAVISLAIFAVFAVTSALFIIHNSLFTASAQNFVGPTAGTVGTGAGAIGVDSSNNLAIGTSTPQSDTKLLIVGTSTGSSYFAIKVLDVNRGPLFVVRSDGSVTIGSPAIQSNQTGSTTTIPGVGAAPANGALFVNGPIFTTLDIKANGLAIGTTTPQSGGNVYVSGNIVAGGSLTGSNYAGTVGANNVTAGVFATGNFAFPASVGIATSTQVGLPQSLSVYGGGYFSGSVGIGTVSPGQPLSVNGIIESTSGGFKFPDGNTQGIAISMLSGTIKLTSNVTSPFTCNSSNDGALAATSLYTTCVCKNGTGWVSTADGSTSCAWGATVNGSCGSANGAAATSTPTTNLCSAGTASAVSGSGPWTWSCTGANGGTTASCSTLTPVEDVFSTYTYTGNGSTQTITNGINLSGQGGMVWLKQRTSVPFDTSNYLMDSARGATRSLISNTTAAETTTGAADLSFQTTGFTTLLSGANSNGSGSNYVSWTFRKAPKFFDVVTYTGDGTTDRQISHSLGIVPGMVIIKKTSVAGVWNTWHRSLSPAYQWGLALNTTEIPGTTQFSPITASTETTITLRKLTESSGTTDSNASGVSYVAYLFAHDTSANGVIQAGSFTTDGSGLATVTLGWEPQYLLVKRVDLTGNWFVDDTIRGWPTSGGSGYKELNPNLANAEYDGTTSGVTATGFKPNMNASATYIYLAIRKAPMKTPTLASQVFNTLTTAKSQVTQNVTGLGFSPDFGLMHPMPGNPGAHYIFDRLRGADVGLISNTTAAEGGIAGTILNTFLQDGIRWGDYSQYWNGTAHFFRRAPGFFDEVAYTGTGSATTVTHNLGVVPELMIVKARNAAGSWRVYDAYNGPTGMTYIDNTAAWAVSSPYWNNTAPTNSVFTIGTAPQVNTNGNTYVAYLFASVPGVSKVGSYTSTGAAQTINAGFSTSARFVLIKRTDAAGDWYLYDSTNGIVASGNDPYILLNSTAIPVTTTNYIDPDSTGFYLNAATPINTSGGTYIYYAISTTPVPVNGSCGSANGVAVTSAPSTNLCGAGTAGSVTGTGPWSWNCNGSGGGTNASCSAPLALTITASTGANGSISPTGAVAVTQGNNQAFTITPNSGYAVSSVLVDSVSQGAISSYTFTNVQTTHTISASFVALPSYTITASAGAGGSISPTGAVAVTQGNNQAFTISPSTDYNISSVLVDSVSQGAISSYTFTNVQTTHTISATFYYNPPPPPASCSSQTIVWNNYGGGTGCSGNISAANDGSFSTTNNTVLGKQGSARFDCSNGTWVLNGVSVCRNYCAADGALFSQWTLRESGIFAQTQCIAPGYTWQLSGGPSLPAGYCVYGTMNYADNTKALVGSQCYLCQTGTWAAAIPGICPTVE